MMLLILTIAAFVAGLGARQMAKAFRYAMMVLAILGVWNVFLAAITVFTAQVADPVGGIAQMSGYIIFQLICGLVLFTVAALAGCGIRKLFARSSGQT